MEGEKGERAPSGPRLCPPTPPCPSPTILASEAGKLAITVALGFDSYLVMRHGVRGGPASAAAPAAPPSEVVETAAAPGGVSAGASATPDTPVPASPALGCYFCGDVVGPLNSMLSRTLDQQCTVTRPGCAPIASAMAVELFVSLLHHPLGVRRGSGERIRGC